MQAIVGIVISIMQLILDGSSFAETVCTISARLIRQSFWRFVFDNTGKEIGQRRGLPDTPRGVGFVALPPSSRSAARAAIPRRVRAEPHPPLSGYPMQMVSNWLPRRIFAKHRNAFTER